MGGRAEVLAWTPIPNGSSPLYRHLCSKKSSSQTYALHSSNDLAIIYINHPNTRQLYPLVKVKISLPKSVPASGLAFPACKAYLLWVSDEDFPMA